MLVVVALPEPDMPPQRADSTYAVDHPLGLRCVERYVATVGKVHALWA